MQINLTGENPFPALHHASSRAALMRGDNQRPAGRTRYRHKQVRQIIEGQNCATIGKPLFVQIDTKGTIKIILGLYSEQSNLVNKAMRHAHKNRNRER